MYNILLIEQSKSQLHILRQILSKAGHSITGFSSFDSALISTRNHKKSYDHIILGWPPRASKLDITKIVNITLSDTLHKLPLTIFAENGSGNAAIQDLARRRTNVSVLVERDYRGMLLLLQGSDESYLPDPTQMELKIPEDLLPEVPQQQHKKPRPLQQNKTEKPKKKPKQKQLKPIKSKKKKGTGKDIITSPGNTSLEQGEIKILLVDDSGTARKKYSDLLTSEGYQVVVANSTEEGWKQASVQLVDLAVIDYNLPTENGDALCRRFNADLHFKSLPCAILSGTYSDDTILQSLKSGAVEVMFKSEPDELFLARICSLANQIQHRKSATLDRHRYEAILSSIGDGIYGVNRQGMIIFMNPAGRKILGYQTATGFIGKSAATIFHHSNESGEPIPQASDELIKAYTTGSVLEKHEVVFWRQDGEHSFVECTVYPLPARFGAQGSVVAFRDVSERKRLERQLFWQATHDSLTSLYNRYRFEKALKFEFKRLQRLEDKKQSALLFIDLDQFKYLNDTAGHDAGDHLLVDVANKLKSVVRKSDVLARLGGDEFAVLLKDVNNDTAFKIAENLRHALEEVTYINEDISFKLSCTIGVAIMRHNMTPKEAMVNADIACNIAKNRGRNQSWLFNEEKDFDKDGLNADMGWSTRLNDALANDGFVLFYQPILPLSEIDFEFLPDSASKLWTALSHLPEHYECLLRLVGEDGEYISPFAFMNVAERFNLMQAIDIWVVNHALTKLKGLQVDGREINFSINLSGSSLNDADTLEEITALMRKSGVQKGSVLFEITETSAIEKKDEARNFIETMRSEGWRFALDDFGTGFSSFSQLKELPVDVVKIDGQFVRDMAKDDIDRAIVMAINDIAHSQGMETIAEYVEDQSILRLLNICGIDHAQGYYIAKPLIDVRERADNTQMLRLVEPLSGA